jgi:hypothetical protein
MKTLALLAWVVSLQVGALAQSATITGTIADPDGGIVKDAVVQAKNAATSAVLRGTGSPQGEYSLTLPAGAYDLSVVMPCCQYGSFTQPNVVVRAGETRRVNIRVPWGTNLGTLGDDPILLLNDFRDRAAVPTGPAPRTREGQPDLSGIWINVYNPDTPPPPLQPWAAQLQRQRAENDSKDYPGAYCLPANAASITRAFPYKFVQTPALIVAIHESDTPGLRQIFLDGRAHPANWNPTWQGHSVGHWDGDTLVVDTIGFNDKTELPGGYRHTEALHVVERFHRTDFNNLDYEATVEDPNVFEKPWTIVRGFPLRPDLTKVDEFICENNHDYSKFFEKK